MQTKTISGFGGHYAVSADGNVFSNFKVGIKRLRPRYSQTGYARVYLCDGNGFKDEVLIHRLVAEAFIPNPEMKEEVNHKDGDKKNNSFENLEWVSRSENIRHSYRIGARRKQIESLRARNRIRCSIAIRGVCEKDGKVITYESISEAERDGFARSSIMKCLSGARKSHRGFRWEQHR